MLLSSAAPSSFSQAAEPHFVVSVVSGRQFQGTIDATSNGSHVVLRTEKHGMMIRRPIEWHRITSATSDGNPADLVALRQQAIDRQPQLHDQPQSLIKRIELRTALPPDEPAIESPPPVRVALVAFDAYVANWDADLETDGLVLDVAPSTSTAG